MRTLYVFLVALMATLIGGACGIMLERHYSKTNLLQASVASTNIEQKVVTKAIELPDVGAKVKLFGYEYVVVKVGYAWIWLAHRNPTDGTIVYTEMSGANYVILVSRSN